MARSYTGQGLQRSLRTNSAVRQLTPIWEIIKAPLLIKISAKALIKAILSATHSKTL